MGYEICGILICRLLNGAASSEDIHSEMRREDDTVG
jgi:hypothetical protein